MEYLINYLINSATLFGLFAIIIVCGSVMVWINDGWNGGPK